MVYARENERARDKQKEHLILFVYVTLKAS